MKGKSVGAYIVFAVIAAVSVILIVISTEQGRHRSVRRDFEVLYRFTVRNVPAGAKRITAWVPLPLSNAQQSLKSFRVEGSWPPEVLGELVYGSRFLHLDLSGAEGDIEVAIRFHVERKAYRKLGVVVSAEASPSKSLDKFLAPARLIPIDGKIAEEALRVACDVEGPLATARCLYDHIVATMTYDKSGEGWGLGDALWACDVRTGNCTDFHSLFIGEARALGVPTRFIMGLPLPEGKSRGEIPGYHCWAEFYLQKQGWVPIDASEANRFPEKKEALFGGLDANRVAFTIGRDVVVPGASAEPLNYVIYPHVEVDGETHVEVETRFSFRDVGPAATARVDSR
ncbi:MAG: transglutaminase-like domain-containing protein [Planctomycetia bacterium]|nr:transglutaminase-like domain-containing protein [Planctomycetia bacterium]